MRIMKDKFKKNVLLKSEIALKKITSVKLASYLGVTQVSVSNWIRGVSKISNPEVVKKMLDMGFSWEAILNKPKE